MLLKRLVEYSQRLDLPPVMYLKTPVKWLVDLDADGRLLTFVAMTSGKKNDRGADLFAPTIKRTVGVKAKLLCDTAEYVLGLARGPMKQARVSECHGAFGTLVTRCVAVTGEAQVGAVEAFLARLDLATLPLPPDLDAGDTLTFRVGGQLPIELPSVRSFWAEETGAVARKEEALAQCLVCGAERLPTERMPVSIKRVPGGKPSGTALISANAPAFESYGLRASLIAPICHDCAERHAKAANALIENEGTRIFLGPLVYVFWTRREEEGFSFASLLSSPRPEDVKELLAGPLMGRDATSVGPTNFFAAAFSASGGRVVVRDWLETTVEQAKRSIARWFRLQRLVENDGGAGHPLGLFPLASSLVRDLRRDLSPNIPKVLLRAALHGGPLPVSLLFEAVKRNRAEQAITRPRAALIKAVLLSEEQEFEEDSMTKLEPGILNPAYLCGRLLAVLESVQYAALGKTNTTITSRFYGTASSAPASVFGRLLRGAQAHLGKLRVQKAGSYEALQKRLEEVQEKLPSFPLILTLQEQGLFALGYYHQRAADRAARLAHFEAQSSESSDSEQDA